ncbi:MAG: MarR family transcriptional regulator [Candidatus Aenigmarchaeota archaeon]|nr:MarR family transcriptional regulator [Candidatus Aenigmarchaeota archaeon]
MITFACRTINLEDVLRCSFNITKTEYKVLYFILRHKKEYTASCISRKMGLERTTIQKALKSLVNKGLLKRRKKILLSGGYVFLYDVDKEVVKGKVKDIVSAWYKKAIDKINNI